MSIGSYTQNSPKHTELLAKMYEVLAGQKVDLAKLVDFERQKTLLKAAQKLAPSGVSISTANNKLTLQFVIAGDRKKKSLPDTLSDVGILNVLVKANLVSEALKTVENTTDFWGWFDSEILEQKEVRDNLITIAKAIETVKANFFASKDRCGRDRSDADLLVNSQAGYHQAYGNFYKKIPESLLNKQCKAKYLIPYLDEFYGKSKQKKSAYYINAKNAVRKLLVDSKLYLELQEFDLSVGKIQTQRQSKDQPFDLAEFILFRERALGLNGNKLNGHQKARLSQRKSWFKAICFNLIYGFRCGEFKAIANLDKPVIYNGEVYPALTDPNNEKKTVILADRYTITCDDGSKHSVTIKTADRKARPLEHPDYPSLVEMFDIFNTDVEFPEVVCKATSKANTIKQAYSIRMWINLSRLGESYGFSLTQTHAFRHYANHVAKLLGLTRHQAALTLGHGDDMNNKYTLHVPESEQHEFLYKQINPSVNETAELKAEVKLLKEQLEFLKRENAQLKRLLSSGDNIIDFPDNNSL